MQSLRVSSEVIPTESIKLCADTETLSVGLSSPLAAGSEVEMSITFQGELNDKMKGLYRSKYVKDGKDRYIATSQFEATDARRCFPCWDEPAAKATFSVSIIAPKDRTVHSNMEETKESDAGMDEMSAGEVTDAHKLVCFNQSPIMSTYLLAIIVGDFESLDVSHA